LEFDFQTSKMDQQNYAELRQQLEWEVVHVLRLLDAFEPCTALEQHITPLRQRPTGISPVLPAGACLSCGAGLQNNEPFCPSCGQEPRAREEQHAMGRQHRSRESGRQSGLLEGLCPTPGRVIRR
jgi:hypothetical protein